MKRLLTITGMMLALTGVSQAFYAKIGAGIAFPSDLKLEIVDTNPGSFDEIRISTVKFSPSPRFTLALGHSFWETLRIELEGGITAYPVQSIKTYTTQPDNPFDQPTTEFENTDDDLYLTFSGMLNAIYSFKICPMLEFYLGAGAGVAKTVFELNAENDSIGLKPHIAGQGMTGLSFCPFECLSLNLGYRFLIESKGKGDGIKALNNPYSHIVETSLKIGF